MDIIDIISCVGLLLLVTLAVLKFIKTGKLSPEDIEMASKLLNSLKSSYENESFAVFVADTMQKIKAGEYDKNAKEAIKFLQGLLPNQNEMRQGDLTILIDLIRERK